MLRHQIVRPRDGQFPDEALSEVLGARGRWNRFFRSFGVCDVLPGVCDVLPRVCDVLHQLVFRPHRTTDISAASVTVISVQMFRHRQFARVGSTTQINVSSGIFSSVWFAAVISFKSR